MNYHQQTSVAQINMEDWRENEKRRTQRICCHRFFDAQLFDHENDRILDLSECEKCGYQK